MTESHPRDGWVKAWVSEFFIAHQINSKAQPRLKATSKRTGSMENWEQNPVLGLLMGLLPQRG